MFGSSSSSSSFIHYILSRGFYNDTVLNEGMHNVYNVNTNGSNWELKWMYECTILDAFMAINRIFELHFKMAMY